MSTLTADPKVGKPEAWMQSASANYNADYNKDRVEYYDDDEDYDFDDGLGEPLPKGWEEELKNDPVFMAELEQQSARIDAETAAGTWVGHSTEEVFDWLHKQFPHVFGVKYG